MPEFLQTQAKNGCYSSLEMPTSHVEYFVGLFWNNHFIVETHGYLGNHPLYAPLTFEDDKGRRLTDWMVTGKSCGIRPSAGQIGQVMMSVPMELMLLENNQLAVTPDAWKFSIAICRSNL